MKKDCKCTDCKCGKQVEIGQNGEVVTISLTEYEDLLEDRKLLINLYKADGDTEKKNNKN